MVCNFELPVIPEKELTSSDIIKNYSENLVELAKQYNGRIVKKDHHQFLFSYVSVTDCIHCALQICHTYNFSTCNTITSKIGIHAGVPVTEKNTIFEECIKLATMICYVSKANIVISKEVNDLYTSENMNVPLNNNSVYSLNKLEEKFIESFFDYLEENWRNTQLRIEYFCVQLGYSKSRLYRIATDLFGKSPNKIIMDYRLNQSLKLLRQNPANISEVAFETGFSSPSYFTKCFHKKYNLCPTDFISSH